MKICALVNDSKHGVMGLRAHNITKHLGESYQVRIFYRDGGKAATLIRFIRLIWKEKPDVIYMLNIGYAGGGAGLLYKFLRGAKLILDHGDPTVDLLKATGGRQFWEYVLADLMEKVIFKSVDAIIARGAFLAATLRKKYRLSKVLFIPDGVDTKIFKPLNVVNLRRKLGLSDVLTIGVVGSIVWSEEHQICYGWDIIEALNLLKDMPVKGIIVGDGTGLEKLKSKADEYEISANVIFTGRVPHSEVPKYLNLMDICISTQSNDLIGASRTTAKLPEYLACGKFVIATNVGGAQALITDNGLLLPYQGIKDLKHPYRLAKAIETILQAPDVLGQGKHGILLAAENFKYEQLAKQIETILLRLF